MHVEIGEDLALVAAHQINELQPGLVRARKELQHGLACHTLDVSVPRLRWRYQNWLWDYCVVKKRWTRQFSLDLKLLDQCSNIYSLDHEELWIVYCTYFTYWQQQPATVFDLYQYKVALLIGGGLVERHDVGEHVDVAEALPVRQNQSDSLSIYIVEFDKDSTF